jgi:hypothetical protein
MPGRSACITSKGPGNTCVIVSRAALLVAFVLLAAGCGSDDEGAATTTTAEAVSRAEVESALQADLGQGGSGIVQHETEPQIVCGKDTGPGWRCTVDPDKGRESYMCVVEVDPQTRKVTKRSCVRVDN